MATPAATTGPATRAVGEPGDFATLGPVPLDVVDGDRSLGF